MFAPEKAFVNSFWGQKDAGFSVIQTRIKHSLNTLQEILYFYKERIAIEKEYNKKLNRLATHVILGSNETGSLKVALDKFQAESSNMAAQNEKFIKSVTEQNYDTLQRFQQVYSRNVSRMESHMSKILAKKTDYLQYLENAKEKYKTACSQIKTLNLLCQTTWGKENEKHQAKLSKVQSSVDSLRDSYQQCIVKYNEMHHHWVSEWTIALSSYYQLEIERIQICKLNGFSFCNHVASLCVDWDSAVDVSRSTFAKVGAPKDAYDFVEVYGTGNEIPMPPKFVDFMAGMDDDAPPEFSTADFKDPDFSQILNRTFSTMSGIRREPVSPAKAGGSPAHEQRRASASPEKSLPPIQPTNHLAVKHISHTPKTSQDTTGSLDPTQPLRKQPSRSTYTSEADDRHDVFDKNSALRSSNTSSDYSNPTNYSANTGRSWASPKRRSVHEVQKEINRRSQDMSVFVSPAKERPAAKNVPVAKDFSIDFIAKALEDLNAGGDGDMTKFRRSVRQSAHADDSPRPPSDLVNDSHEIATRLDSISFRSPDEKKLRRRTFDFSERAREHVAKHDNRRSYNPKQKRNSFVAEGRISEVSDEASMNTIVRSPEKTRAGDRRSLSQSPTKSYIDLRPFVGNTTPVSRSAYVTKAVAKYTYSAREEGELSFRKGWHLFVIHKQEDNWYVCELGENCGDQRGQVGLAPYNYLVEGDRVF